MQYALKTCVKNFRVKDFNDMTESIVCRGRYLLLCLARMAPFRGLFLKSIVNLNFSYVFSDYLFLRRVAYVMTKDGTGPDTYRIGFDGGIWQVRYEEGFHYTSSLFTFNVSHIQMCCYIFFFFSNCHLLWIHWIRGRRNQMIIMAMEMLKFMVKSQ